MSIIVKNDIVCFLSEKGNNNFFYPTTSKAILKKGSEIDRLPWLSGHKKRFCAFVAFKKSIIPLNYNNINAIEILSNSNEKIVIWVEQNVFTLS